MRILLGFSKISPILPLPQRYRKIRIVIRLERLVQWQTDLLTGLVDAPPLPLPLPLPLPYDRAFLLSLCRLALAFAIEIRSTRTTHDAFARIVCTPEYHTSLDIVDVVDIVAVRRYANGANIRKVSWRPS